MAKKVDNRNLIVVGTFDEFANKVDKLDFEVEDIVALVTSLANTFYWLNVESVWGPIGFTWSKVDDYGVFNKTTIPFTIIPKLPDGHRIKQFNNTFNNISSNYIEVKKSDWSNLTTLQNLCKGENVRYKFDFTGANITTVNNYLIQHLGDVDRGNSEVYIKGDFSKVPTLKNVQIGNGTYNIANGYHATTFVVDEDNKFLNFPSDANNMLCWYEWRGEGPLKLEYIFRDLNVDSVVGKNVNSDDFCLHNENYLYDITYLPKGCGHIKANYPFRSIPYTDEDPAVDLTIDTRVSGDIRLGSLIDWLNYKESLPRYLPIKFRGEVTSLDYLHPFLYIFKESDFPVQDDTFNYLYSKLTEEGELFRGMVFRKIFRMPYTIDLANRTTFLMGIHPGYFFIGNEVTPSAEDLNKYGVEGYTKNFVDILPTFTNIDHKFDRFVIQDTINASLFFPYNLKATVCELNIVLGNDNIIEATQYNGSIRIEDIGNTHIVVKGSDEIPMRYNNGNTNSVDASVFNFLKIDATTEQLKKNGVYIDSTVHRYGQYSYNNIIGENYDYVFVGANSRDIIINDYQYLSEIRSNFVFIYKSNIGIGTFSQNFDINSVRRILSGLQENDTADTYSVTLKSVYYNQLTDEEKNHIINDLNYVLVNQI